MIQLDIPTIREIIKPVGLSHEVKGIYELSHILINEHGGQVPQGFEALEALPQ